MSQKAENIKVVVRCRPLSKKEVEKGFKPIVDIDNSKGLVHLNKLNEDGEPKSFSFNSAYAWDATQQFIYDDAGRPIVDAVLEGFNGTIFAYGQTGTGKTYTMEGVIENQEHKGIILHAFDHIFAHISTVKDKEFLVRASFLQIYMEDVFDLLGDPKKKLHIRQLEHDISVVGLSQHIVKSPKEITSLLLSGKENRNVSATAMNSQSSRSHSVFTIVVEQNSEEKGTRMGKLHLVDLAGSERLKKTEAVGTQAKEGAKINQSLLSLGNVISGLVTGAKHISYRDSKLTQLLQDSLGGNSKTVMIATLGPASYNYDETLSSLLYATRARDIKNAPKINEDPKDALLGQLREKINLLKKQLEEQNSQSTGGGILVGNNEFLTEIELKHSKEIEELMASKTISEEERQKTKLALDTEFERQKLLKKESEELEIKIKQLEDSVLVGGVNLVDKAKQQEEEMRANASKLRRQQEEQQKLNEKKKEEEELLLNAEKKYDNLKEELSIKTEKILKLKPLIRNLEENIEDLQNQFEREKEEQTNTIKSLSKELLLLQLIVNSFIPQDDLKKIEENSNYDSENNKWNILFADKAGRHQKIEEFIEEKIFIQGKNGPVEFLSRSRSDNFTTLHEIEKAKYKRKIAQQHALNEFALVSNFSKLNPKK